MTSHTSTSSIVHVGEDERLKTFVREFPEDHNSWVTLRLDTWGADVSWHLHTAQQVREAAEALRDAASKLDDAAAIFPDHYIVRHHNTGVVLDPSGEPAHFNTRAQAEAYIKQQVDSLTELGFPTTAAEWRKASAEAVS